LPGDDATRRTTHNGRHVLDELRAHEDDPLAWLGSGRDDSGTNTENPIMSALREAGSLSTPTSEAPPPTRPRASSPPIPRTSSDTVLHRVNSRSPPTSRSWMSALFARAHAPATARHGRYATDGHAATLPLPATKSTLDAAPSPFAAHSFVAPSGAPGFAGDRNWNTAGFEFDGGNGAQGRTLTLVGRKEPTNPVLDGALANLLRPHLPALARLPHSWSLLYSSDQHGLSLKTLYARCAPAPTRKEAGKLSPAGSLVAVQDADGGVFGAWVGEGVHLSHGGYYGGGDSFLWRVDPYEPHALSVYNWTGRNDYVAFCDTDFFSFGGGDGHYGLYLDGSLVEGTTHPCPTFDNECLAQGTRKGRMIAFECVGLEVWGIGP
ncbi:TLD-domain-containing protein, partial [Phellopilus nigrolimitatus]